MVYRNCPSFYFSTFGHVMIKLHWNLDYESLEIFMNFHESERNNDIILVALKILLRIFASKQKLILGTPIHLCAAKNSRPSTGA